MTELTPFQTGFFGIPASDPWIKKRVLDISARHNHVVRRLTFNKMGIDTVSEQGADADGWFLKEFEEYAHTAQKPLLDLGAGFCGATLKALKQGATVIANDLEMDNLLFGIQSIQNTSLLEKLYLNTDRFPESTDFLENSLSGVLAHRMLHFLSGKEIEKGLSKIAGWLQKEGKLFIVTLAPQNQVYRDWLMPLYEENWKDGNPWPGESIDMKKAMPVFAESNPKYLHLMDERPLHKALTKHGFRTEKSTFISRQYQKDGISSCDAQSMYSVIAVKI